MRAGRPSLLIPLVVLILVLSGCGGDEDEENTTASDLPAGCEPVEAPPPKDVDLRRPKPEFGAGDRVTALVETSCGPFEVALDTKSSPKTTSSFAYLAEYGFYNDTSFSYIDEFVIQGGDPTGDRTGGPGYFVDEPPPFNTEYTRGTVAMAKTEVEPIGRGGSQFFVVYAPDAGLPPQFALLGEVRQGLDAVRRIAELRDPGSESGSPRAPVIIERVTITEH
jgi:cyclophilin family peptidyl-prolyl cis-trans isomerase